jgi:dephospho-CoA kinase
MSPTRPNGTVRRPAPPLVIGITGPIASGKSTVARMLEARGAEVIDADQVYHELIVPHSPLWRAIVDQFGGDAIAANGEIDRAALGALVFSNPEKLAELERLTHPAIVDEVRRRVNNSTASVAVVEAVKLVQSGLASDADAVWLVTANPDVRIARLVARGGLPHATARARVAAAESLPASFVPNITIDASGNMTETRHAVDQAWQAFLASAEVMPARAK